MKKYMVFTWSEYDNVSPFECMDFDTDELAEAVEFAKVNGSVSEDGDKLFCIFDRVEGLFVYQFQEFKDGNLTT